MIFAWYAQLYLKLSNHVESFTDFLLTWQSEKLIWVSLRSTKVFPTMNPVLPFLVHIANCHFTLFKSFLHGIVLNVIKTSMA